MNDNIMTAQHGINIVVECEDGKIYIGRFDESNGFEIVMHDADVFDPASGGDAEHWKKETATYGVDVKHKDLRFPASGIKGWVALGDVEKLA
tara:strand:- start:302 stop:577 length:276 start_codon:yes stop_codon:yes gene_type:complete